MNKEKLHILIYFDEELEKIQLKNLVNIIDYDIDYNDLWIFVREEFALNEEIIENFIEHFSLPNEDELLSADIKKIYFTSSTIHCNMNNFKFPNDSIKNDLVELFEFFKEDSNVIEFSNYIIEEKRKEKEE